MGNKRKVSDASGTKFFPSSKNSKSNKLSDVSMAGTKKEEESPSIHVGLIPEANESLELKAPLSSEVKGTHSGFRNKEKVLVLCSRGITYRYRHLMEDLVLLLPHCKKDVKMEHSKENRALLLNEMADLKGCTSSIFFEAKKKKDLYLWMSKTPNGPSAKFLLNSVHTMAELKLTGNHLKGSRPILTFSSAFDSSPHLQLLKEMFVQIFGTPKDHRKAKPFFDHVYAFSVLDNHVWFRNYQIVLPNVGATQLEKGALDKTTLVEVGPRFCMNPIKIFGGSFGGATLYENPLYISPNTIRSQQKRAKAGKYAKKIKAKVRRKQHLQANPTEIDELANVWKE